MGRACSVYLECLKTTYRFNAGQIYFVDYETDTHWFKQHETCVSQIRKSDGALVDCDDVPFTDRNQTSFVQVDSDMKDKHDTHTQELIPARRGRGRPVTGKALSPAEKQARYRARKAQKSVTVTFNRDAVEALDLHIRALAFGHDVSIDPDKLSSILESIRSATQSQLVTGA
ncbi:hypothetical protein ACSZNR_05770 [Aeromonas caviae]